MLVANSAEGGGHTDVVWTTTTTKEIACLSVAQQSVELPDTA